MSVLPSLRVIVTLVAISILLYICVSYQKRYITVISEDKTTIISSKEIRANNPGTSKAVKTISMSSDLILSVSLDYLLKGQFTLDADDPVLIKFVRNHILIPPSKLPYNLSHPDVRDPSHGQTKRALQILHNKKNGFFVEAGGLTGEWISNSLYMERYLGWTGLIVEPDPKNFKELLTKNRKAWLANVCLSPQIYPMKVTFFQHGAIGQIIKKTESKRYKFNEIVVQCIPLLTLLLAVNQTKVDYFSLDVESAELDVLRTIPFEQVDIKLWSVEVNHVPGGAKAVIDYMKLKGYRFHSKVFKGTANDIMLIKNQLTK